MAKTVTRTLMNIMLYVHCLSCFTLFLFPNMPATCLTYFMFLERLTLKINLDDYMLRSSALRSFSIYLSLLRLLLTNK